MSQTIFNLCSNPFFILDAKFGSSAAEIAELVEDAEFEGRVETDELHRAQHSIVTPKTRLGAEVSWFPEVDDTLVERLRDILCRNDVAEMESMLAALPGLARANMAAHLLTAGSGGPAAVGAVVESWDDIRPVEIARFLDKERRRARISSGGIGEEQVSEALDEIRKQHARAAASKIWDASNPGQEMNQLVLAELERNSSGSFLGILVREYDSQSEARLSTILAEVDTHVEDARRCDEGLQDHISSLKELLHAWDDINQPVQVYEQSRGMEEARSRMLHSKLRGLCLELANEQHRFAEALELSEAMLATFPELESVAGSIRKDISDLEELSEQQAAHQALSSLVAACEAVKKSPHVLRNQLEAAAFDESAAGELWEIVTEFRKACRDLADPTPVYMVIRELALYLNNEDEDPETAFLLVNAVLKAEGKRCPAVVSEQLQVDRAVMHKNWLFPKLEASQNNPSKMLSIIDKLLVYANTSDRSDLNRLRGQIARRKWGQDLRKFIRYAIFAGGAVTIVVAMWDQPSSSPSYTPPTSSSYVPSNSFTTAQPPDTLFEKPAKASSIQTNPYEERKPSVGSGQVLDRSEVRYCIFQGDRLDNIKAKLDHTSSHQIDSFNSLVNDFNSRCSYFRYQSGVVQEIRSEAIDQADVLRADAERILARWRVESPSSSGFASQTAPSPSVIPSAPSASNAPTTSTAMSSNTQVPPSLPFYHRSYSQDLRGADLTKDGYRGVTIEQCEAICMGDTACKGYTYIVQKKWCWPKSSTDNPIYGKSGLISGYKVQ